MAGEVRVVQARAPYVLARALAATVALNDKVFEQLGITENQTSTLRTVLRALRANAGDF